jgi:hypothetical protein
LSTAQMGKPLSCLDLLILLKLRHSFAAGSTQSQSVAIKAG